jgi:hypothetical protein
VLNSEVYGYAQVSPRRRGRTGNFSVFLLLTGFANLLKSERPFKNEREGVRRQIVSNLKKRHSVILPVQSSPLSFVEQT